MRLNFSTTKEEELYIEMCNKAKQLQEGWKPKFGDTCIDMGDLCHINKEGRLNYITYWKENDTWLPTEEQLQEMIIAPTMENPINLLERFLDWSQYFINERSREFSEFGDNSPYRKFTIKQLWLCYYMKRRENLEWRNGKWREII